MKKCSRCKQLKSTTEFNKMRTTKDGYTYLCKQCHSKFCKIDYQKNKSKVLERNKTRKVQARQFIKNYLKNKQCMDCGEDCWIVLEFDHTKDKLHNIGDMVSQGYAISTILKEIMKCETVCANCHRKRTYKKFTSYRLV